jgi:molybdopterin-guanine dinucleotide biosynthesis protein A
MNRSNASRGGVAVLVLAGGEGRRLGGGKPLRRVGKRTLLDHAIERGQQWSDTVAVAAKSADQVGHCDLPVLIDQPGIGGPLAGLASARLLGCPLVLTIPCDMPFLPDDLMVRLTAALGNEGASLASSGGRIHPVCGLWRRESLMQLPAYFATGRRSIMGFAEVIGHATVGWDGDWFVNVNTPIDLAQAERRID